MASTSAADSSCGRVPRTTAATTASRHIRFIGRSRTVRMACSIWIIERRSGGPGGAKSVRAAEAKVLDLPVLGAYEGRD